MTAQSHPPLSKPFPSILKPVVAWGAILAVVGLVVLCLMAKAGAVLRILYPASCLVTAVLLYVRYPVLFLGFSWWVWFLTPFVRRLVDLQSGWLDPNPIMLAPFLTVLVTVVTCVRYLPRTLYHGGMPFLLAIAAVLYGSLVGLTDKPPLVIVVPLLNWLTPILFGFHLFANWQQYPLYRRNIQRVFLWGVLVMGIYGVVQYLFAPAWDSFWLSNQATQVFGVPEPLGIRVFSTMNSPQPFACTMAAGLVLLFSGQGGSRFFAAGAGYLALMLTLARSAWLGWGVSLLLFVPSLKQKLQIRLVLSVLIMAILVMPLAAIDPFAEVINTRLQSLFNLTNDVSFNARSQGYSQALGLALTELVGQGLGGAIISDALGANDSGILTLLFLLGWFGTIPYFGGLILLLIRSTQKSEGGDDPLAAACRAIALGAFAQIGLNEAMLGAFGMVLWGFLGLSLAAQRYYWKQKICLEDESLTY
jgi:hypothetical protein